MNIQGYSQAPSPFLGYVKTSAPEANGSKETNERRETIQLSSEARERFAPQAAKQQQDAIERLMERKQELLEAKSTFRERALESGQSLDDIQYELEHFDEQIESVNESIVAIQQAEMEKREREKEEEMQERTQRATDDDVLQYTQLLQQFEQTRSIERVKSLVKQEATYAKQAVERDGARGGPIDDPLAKVGATDGQKERLADLTKRVERLTTASERSIGLAYKGLVALQQRQVDEVASTDETERVEEDERDESFERIG